MSDIKLDDLPILTAKETALYLRVSESWLRENRNNGNGISYFKIGHKIYYEKKDILNWIKANKVRGGDAS